MRVPLTQGSYSARSVIAEAQRSVNLYAEKNPDDAASPFTYYPAPGLTFLTQPLFEPGRGLYMANSGDLYYVAGDTVYYVSPSWVLTSLGTITTAVGIVSMADNGTTLILVDGSPNGYQINLTSRVMTPITEAANGPPIDSGSVYAFYGANRVDIVDGYLVFNEPNTSNFYSTYNNEVIFDALYFAAKNGYSDNLVSLIVTKREIWLIGEKTTEIWFDAGDANFPFEILPGPFIQHGCSAVYSVAQINGTIFWLSQDQAGQYLLLRGEGYNAVNVTTQAISTQWATYQTTADAQAFCFQQNGHFFYQINFPAADRSWRWDDTTRQWHECPFTDLNGIEHRHRAACGIFAYGLNVVCDWQDGTLYNLTPEAYDDAGTPMQFRRGYPHIMQDGKRVRYRRFDFDIAAGLASYYPAATPPLFSLRWSDTRGQTWSAPILQSMGATGKYLTQPQVRRLGMGRDRVFEVYGTVPGEFAINGAFIDFDTSVS